MIGSIDQKYIHYSSKKRDQNCLKSDAQKEGNKKQSQIETLDIKLPYGKECIKSRIFAQKSKNKLRSNPSNYMTKNTYPLAKSDD